MLYRAEFRDGYKVLSYSARELYLKIRNLEPVEIRRELHISIGETKHVNTEEISLRDLRIEAMEGGDLK